MTRFSSPVCTALISLLVVPALSSSWMQGAEPTVVVLKDGRQSSGELTYCTDTRVQLRSLKTGRTQSYAMKLVQRIQFAPVVGETEALADPQACKLTDLHKTWTAIRPYLRIPESNAGAIGLIYGRKLLEGGDGKSAEDVFRFIETRDWSTSRRDEARWERLRAMLASGKSKEAVGEAEAQIKAADQKSEALVAQRFRFIQLEAKAIDLSKLIEENPLWAEDKFVKPVRDRLYHDLLDGFLHAYLFHGSEADLAARGLWGAAVVYTQAGETRRASECARDIVSLYGETPFAAKAATFLQSLEPNPRQINPAHNQDTRQQP